MTEKSEEQMKATYRRRRRGAGLIVVVVGVLLVGVIAALPPREEKKDQTSEALTNVQVLTVRKVAELEDRFVLPAVVEPNVVIRVSAEVAGRVERIGCPEGRSCKAGDMLVELNRELLEAEDLRARAQRELDEFELESITRLHSRGVETDFTLAKAKAKLAASRAAESVAKANLDRTTIVAPVDGVLNRTEVEEGEYVVPGDPVAEIVDVRKVRVVVQVSERDVGFLRVGDAAEILPDLASGRAGVSSTIDYIDELADLSSRTTKVEILVDNSQRVLRTGQIVRASLKRRIVENAIMIPLAAVIPLEKGRVVYTVAEGKAQRREVKLGFLKGQSVQVLAGLEDGDELIVQGQQYVAQDQDVVVLPADAASAVPAWSARTGKGDQ
jgi:membrane fusion protein, multidrug efflux system